jgi:hypothetical protein
VSLKWPLMSRREDFTRLCQALISHFLGNRDLNCRDRFDWPAIVGDRAQGFSEIQPERLMLAGPFGRHVAKPRDTNAVR